MQSAIRSRLTSEYLPCTLSTCEMIGRVVRPHARGAHGDAVRDDGLEGDKALEVQCLKLGCGGGK